MNAVYVGKSDKNIPCRNFGMIVEDVKKIDKNCLSSYQFFGTLSYLGGVFFMKEDLYFQNHPQGYNQPCFR